MTPRLATTSLNSASASVGATPGPSPSAIVRGTPTKVMPSMPASHSAPRRSASSGLAWKAVTWVQSPLTASSSGLTARQKSSVSIRGLISTGRSLSSAIIPGIITCRTWPSSPLARHCSASLRPSAVARSVPASR